MSAYEIALLASAINLAINYCIGKPGNDFSPYEIFSRYTVKLSIRRLQDVQLYEQYVKQYSESISRAATKYEIISLKNDFRKMLYFAAEPYFKWERAAGMCSVCTGFWVSIITGLFFTHNFVALITIVVISHIITRIINKYL